MILGMGIDIIEVARIEVAVRTVWRAFCESHPAAGRNRLLPFAQKPRAVSGRTIRGEGGHFQGVRHRHRRGARLAGHGNSQQEIRRAVRGAARQGKKIVQITPGETVARQFEPHAKLRGGDGGFGF